MDQMYNRPLSTSQPSNPPLYPLTVPQWPSQLTNPSEPDTHPPAQVQLRTPRPIAPVTTIPPVQSAPPAPVPIPAPPTGRRTLTDQDRRRMCQYHDEHPSIKQTEIGSLFGVERSTVSKVLRQKDKYLHPDDGSRSPIKRSKGKFPDIERALANWAKNHQSQGFPLDNDMIRDKARVFATTVGSSECIVKVNSIAWLEKFKQKNGLLGASLPTEPEEPNSKSGNGMDPKSGSQTPNGVSPISPDGLPTSSPTESQLKRENSDSHFDFTTNYRRTNSQSTNSPTSGYTDSSIQPAFYPDIRSPTSPFFSPVSSCGPSPSISLQTPRLPALASADARPRRQTFPTISASGSYITPPASASTETSSTPYFQQPMAASVLKSPLESTEHPSLSVDSKSHNGSSQQVNTSSTPILSNSPSTMAPPPNPSPSVIASPRVSSNSASRVPSPALSTPSQDEARKALEVLMSFFKSQPSAVSLEDYINMERLLEKLKLRGDEMPGGMRPMERGDGTIPMGRKRSIHSLS
ncbi:MAG: hypothetical protein LQ351_005866 [Letrouitia transgressa]|nr:MAG: hypothetical protein LQ351_005866 [Letrouitia transgressa]